MTDNGERDAKREFTVNLRRLVEDKISPYHGAVVAVLATRVGCSRRRVRRWFREDVGRVPVALLPRIAAAVGCAPADISSLPSGVKRPDTISSVSLDSGGGGNLDTPAAPPSPEVTC